MKSVPQSTRSTTGCPALGGSPDVPSITAHSIRCLCAINSSYGKRQNDRMLPPHSLYGERSSAGPLCVGRIAQQDHGATEYLTALPGRALLEAELERTRRLLTSRDAMRSLKKATARKRRT